MAVETLKIVFTVLFVDVHCVKVLENCVIMI
jgi:hypothetical protein